MTDLPHPLELRFHSNAQEPQAREYDAAFLLDSARIRRWLAMRLERFAKQERAEGHTFEADWDARLARKLRDDAAGFEGRASRKEVCAASRAHRSLIHRQGRAGLEARNPSRGTP